jgi:hypothetical protein
MVEPPRSITHKRPPVLRIFLLLGFMAACGGGSGSNGCGGGPPPPPPPFASLFVSMTYHLGVAGVPISPPLVAVISGTTTARGSFKSCFTSQFPTPPSCNNFANATIPSQTDSGATTTPGDATVSAFAGNLQPGSWTVKVVGNAIPLSETCTLTLSAQVNTSLALDTCKHTP